MENKYSKPYGKSVFEALTMVTQFAVNMLVPIGLLTFCGYKLDQWLGTWCFTIVLFFVGALAGGRNVYVMAKKLAERSDTKEEK